MNDEQHEPMDRATLKWWIDHASELEAKNTTLQRRLCKLEETLAVVSAELNRIIIEDKPSLNS